MSESGATPPSLREVTQDLTNEVRKMRRTMRVQNALLAGAVAVLVVAVCAVGFVTWQNHLTNAKLQRVIAQNQADIAESDRKLCPIVGAVLNPEGAPPPTARGKEIAALFTKLFVDYGCTPEDIPQLPPSSPPNP